jgi:hypothetical protein
VKEIPYDYVATFLLEGRVGNRIQDVINISTEGAFVAAAIGYSLLPHRPPDPAPPPQNANARRMALINNRRGAIGAARLAGAAAGAVALRNAILNQLAPAAAPNVAINAIDDILDCLVFRLCGIDFLYSIVDSGSGRELQNQPIHNLAGLGNAQGDRPFRPLARPMIFMPRSTIRIEIIEQSSGDTYAGSRLYFVLHGYKILGYTPQP